MSLTQLVCTQQQSLLSHAVLSRTAEIGKTFGTTRIWPRPAARTSYTPQIYQRALAYAPLLL